MHDVPSNAVPLVDILSEQTTCVLSPTKFMPSNAKLNAGSPVSPVSKDNMIKHDAVPVTKSHK
jgi:hypothetical protein